MTAINIITNEAASGIIEHGEPKGLFYTMESGRFVGIDNSTGDVWVEEFQSEMECRDWLIRQEDTHEKEIYKKALLKWGEGAQIAMVFEEMAELQKELCKCLRGKNVTGQIAEEIADVEIMLSQMKTLFKIENQVEDAKQYKLARLEGKLNEPGDKHIENDVKGWK